MVSKASKVICKVSKAICEASEAICKINSLIGLTAELLCTIIKSFLSS